MLARCFHSKKKSDDTFAVNIWQEINDQLCFVKIKQSNEHEQCSRENRIQNLNWDQQMNRYPLVSDFKKF